MYVLYTHTAVCFRGLLQRTRNKQSWQTPGFMFSPRFFEDDRPFNSHAAQTIRPRCPLYHAFLHIVLNK